MFLTRLITIAAVLILLGVAGAGARLVSTAAAARQADDQQQPAAELQALRVELQEAKQQIQQLKEALRLAQQSSRQTRPRLYRGKPISYWIEQLSDGDPSYRKEAVTVLGVISRDDRSAIDPLLGALRDKDETVRYEAAYSLGRADASAIPSLTALLKEQGEMQRLAAVALSYHAREAKSAIPALIDALKSRDREARKAVARTLMLMGPMARETVPALIQALKVDLNMQGEVFQALGQIEPEAQEILPRRFFDPDTKYAAESSKQIEELKRDWQKAIEKLERKYPPRPIKP